MASISFTDSIGAATLACSWPSGAPRRFANWTPFQRPIGEGANELGTGKRHQFAFRTDYGAAFEVNGIANTDLDIALRLQEHLIGGGEITVTTDDLSSRVHTCTLAPGTEPEIPFSDRQMLEYSFRVTVLDAAATPGQLLCEY